MEAAKLPRLELDPNKSRLHPSNLINGAINGLAVLEEFRLGTAPEPGPSPRAVRMREKSDQAQAEYDEWRDGVLRRAVLRTRANEDPQRYMETYLSEEKDYHVKRASKLGSHITALEIQKPKFIKARKWFAEKRRSYHKKRALRAATKFIDFALSEA